MPIENDRPSISFTPIHQHPTTSSNRLPNPIRPPSSSRPLKKYEVSDDFHIIETFHVLRLTVFSDVEAVEVDPVAGIASNCGEVDTWGVIASGAVIGATTSGGTDREITG